MKKPKIFLLIAMLIFTLTACGDSQKAIVEEISNAVSNDDILDIFSDSIENRDDFVDFHITPYGDGFFYEGKTWIQYRNTEKSIKNKDGIIIDNSNAEEYAAIVDKQGNVLWEKQGTILEAMPFRDGISFCLLDNGNTQSYIIFDAEGEETYTFEKDENYLMLGRGNGLVLVAKHISDFDNNEWQIGAIDQYGNVVVPFKVYEKPQSYSFESLETSYKTTYDIYMENYGDIEYLNSPENL